MSATHRWRGAELLERVKRNTIAALDRSAIIVDREIKRQLNKHKSPPPSAPGSPPGKLHGHLGRSVQIDRSKIAAFRVRVGPGVIYARIHELGGTILPRKGPYLWWRDKAGKLHRAKKVVMPKRPYVKPAARVARPRVLAQFSAARLLRA